MNLNQNPTSKFSNIRVGITLGDPAGIGPIIIHKAIRTIKKWAAFVVIGDRKIFQKAASGRDLDSGGVEFIDLHNVKHKNFKFGELKAEYGRASLEYLDKALELLKGKKIDCLVTCPVSKEAISEAGFKFSGHTEYLAQKTKTEDFAMLLLNKALKFALVTRHLPLVKVSKSLNKDKLQKTILMVNSALKALFGIRTPRIVVCGLNPHASDNGVLGNEENRIIKPVVERLINQFQLHIDGPFSADAAIYKAGNKQYDCVIAMYHDQALIPLKLTDFDSGVNLTLGLPFVRVSPLHGTGFDIVGEPQRVNPNSFIAAVKLAIQCTQNLKKV